MIAFPNAKINLGLNVVAKRSDGFHDIETAFLPIPLCDVLEIVPNSNAQSTLTNYGIKIDGNANENLCLRAVRLLQKQFNIANVDIFLHKNIPFGAGLGGGSADASMVLKMLNDLFSLKLTDGDLANYASQIGSDCAFFIKNKSAIASGRGEVLQDFDINLSGLFLVLAKPNFGVSTAQAYASVTPCMPQKHISEILCQPIETWCSDLKNDFEPSVFAQFPKIEEIKRKMYSLGAVYAAMSGSGSTVFGLFRQKVEVRDFDDCFCFTDFL